MVEKYKKYDNLFTNVVPNAVSGIIIFGESDPYRKPQKYDLVNNLENKIWRDLFENLKRLLDQYASREFIMGMKALPIPNDRFPEFESISALLQNSTGWQLEPVAGFLEEGLFFDLNANRKFPVTDIIRKSPRFSKKYKNINILNNRGYTPEPDIFHDIHGHVPFLMNRDYSDFLHNVGILGDEILKDKNGLGLELVSHNLKRLQNFAWWTYEFGLIRNTGETDKFRRRPNDIEYEIYGSGIISSYDETQNVINCAKGNSQRSRFLPFDMEEIVMTCIDYSDIQDRYFVADSIQDRYKAFTDNRDLFLYKN